MLGAISRSRRKLARERRRPSGGRPTFSTPVEPKSSTMTNRWHNMLGSFADWDKIRADLENLHKNAEDAGFNLKIVDEACPCCGFRPAVLMTERRQSRQKKHVE